MIKQGFKIAKSHDLKIWRLAVFAAGFILSLGIYLLLKDRFAFEFHQHPDVYGWVAEHRYPKQQDLFYYVYTLSFIPACVIAFYFLWIFLSLGISRLGKASINFILKREALTSLPLLLILRRISVAEPSFRSVLLTPIVIALLIKIILLTRDILVNRFPTISKSLLKDKLLSHAVVLASGLCAGFLYLVNRSPDGLSANSCFLYLAGMCTLVWGIWIVYSLFLGKFSSMELSDALEADALTYAPLCLFPLQFILWAFRVPGAGAITWGICILAVISMKIYVLLSSGKSVELSRYRRIGNIVLCYAILPALIYTLVYNSSIHGGIDVFHEGERMGSVSGMLRGKVPYRDIYMQHGLFQNAIKPFIATKLFGVSAASDRTMGNTLSQRGLTNPFGYIAVYLLALWLLRKKMVAVLTVLLLASVYMTLNDRHAVALLGLAFVAKYISSKRNWNLVAAGVFGGLGIFNSFDTGMFGLVSAFLFLAVYSASLKGRRFRPLLSYGLGFSIGFFSVAFFLSLFGAFDDFFHVSFRQAGAYHMPTWGISFPRMDLAGMKSIRGFIDFLAGWPGKWYLPPIIYTLSLTYMVYRAISRRFEDEQWRLLLITFGGIFFFRSALGRSGANYIYFSMPLCWLIIVYIVHLASLRGWKALREMRSELLLKAFVLLCPLLLLLWYVPLAYEAPLDRLRGRIGGLTTHKAIPSGVVELNLKRAGGIMIPTNQASMIEGVVNYIQSNTSQDDTVFDFANHGVLYLLMDRENPTKYYLSVYIASWDMQREAALDLEKRKTKYVLFQHQGSFHGLPTVEKRQKILYDYVMENYSEEISIGGIQILRRNDTVSGEHIR